MTLNDLTELEHKRQCEKSHFAKSGYLPKKKFSDTSEKGLKECIEKHCELTGFGFFWRTPNKSSIVGTKTKIKAGTETHEAMSGLGIESKKPVYGFSSGTNGMSDMAGFIHVKYKNTNVPISVALEIKIPGDTQKSDQIDFEAMVKSRGGIYVIVKDFPSYIQIVNKIRDFYVNLFV